MRTQTRQAGRRLATLAQVGAPAGFSVGRLRDSRPMRRHSHHRASIVGFFTFQIVRRPAWPVVTKM